MNIFRALLTLLCLAFFLAEPELILTATKNAIDIWLTSVLPALLPFFILNNLCFTYGGITLFGSLLQPLTRKLFNLPGEVAFVIATGYSTGAPVSSTSIAALHKAKTIDKRSADLLLPFTANVSPLFIFSVVSASFLCRSDLGVYLALVHYGSNLLLGTAILLLCRPKDPVPTISFKAEMHRLQNKDTTPLGQGLSEAVFQGLRTIGLIGGLIIVFFIFLAVIHFWAIDTIIAYILSWLGVEPEVTLGLIQGITEITAGTKYAAAMNQSVTIKFSTICFILAFGGISTLCQIATQIKGTDLSLKFYFFYKIAQGILAFCLSLLVPIEENVINLNTTMVPPENSSIVGIYGLILPVALIFLVWLIRRLQHKRWKKLKSFYQ